jgi:hypothetical protein
LRLFRQPLRCRIALATGDRQSGACRKSSAGRPRQSDTASRWSAGVRGDGEVALANIVAAEEAQRHRVDDQRAELLHQARDDRRAPRAG